MIKIENYQYTDEPENMRTDFPIPRQQDNEQTIKWKIDPEDVIQEIIHYLRGDTWDDNNNEWSNQGYIFKITIHCPPWFHLNLFNAEVEQKIKFDKSEYNNDSEIGNYIISDNVSYEKIIKYINEVNLDLKQRKQRKKIKFESKKLEPQRLINENGLRVISTNLRGYLNKNIILSNLDNEMIKRIALENAKQIILLIFTTYDKYDIKRENFSTILRIIDVNIYSALLRAKDGFFVNHLSTTHRYIESNTLTQQEKKKERNSIVPNIFGSWRNDKQ